MRRVFTSHSSYWRITAWVTFIALVITGTLFIYDSSLVESFDLFGTQYGILLQHLSGLGLGLIAMICVWLIPNKYLIKAAPILYVGGLILLLGVFIPGLGVSVNGASRWIQIFGIRLQPVEFFKPAYLIFIASLLYDKSKAITKVVASLFVPAIIILLQPDLGSLLIVITSAMLVYLFAGASLKNLSILVLAGLPILIIAIILAPYRLARLTTFFNPNSDPLGASFHIRQITLALGQGGWLGKGIGNSSQKFAYIPETSTDSIFAIVAEEIGFIGSSTIILLFALLIISLIKIASTTTQPSILQLAKLSMVGWLSLQILLNLASVVGLVPLTGVPLPFFSYGRSAQIVVWWAVGFILKQEKN